jgi:uncharacterized integral membrane protein
MGAAHDGGSGSTRAGRAPPRYAACAMADVDPTRAPTTAPGKKAGRKERGFVSKSIAAIAIAFLLLAFGISNDNLVSVNYLVATRDSPLILVIGVSALLGAIIGALVMRRPRARGRGRSATRAPGP